MCYVALNIKYNNLHFKTIIVTSLLSLVTTYQAAKLGLFFTGPDGNLPE